MLAAAAVLGAVSYGAWYGLDEALGRSCRPRSWRWEWPSPPALAVYAAAVWALRVPEARQIRALLPGGRGR